MALGFANAWWLFPPPASSPRQPGVTFVSGVLAGLMLCTSPGVFLAFMPFLAALWLRRVNDMREIAPSLVAAGLGGGLAHGTLPDAALPCTPAFLPAVFSGDAGRNAGSQISGHLFWFCQTLLA